MITEYTKDEEILELVRSFENATIARDDWRHTEHLVVALYYTTEYELQTATDKMRAGIFNLLSAFMVDLTKEMPYHETLTVFWMRTVDEFRKANAELSMFETANALVRSFDKEHPLKFYSRGRLFSDEARSNYIEPELRPS